MVAFWLLAALMTLVALAFVLVPLLRPRTTAGPTAIQANLEVLRGHRREIEADVANGTLPADARDEALRELVERADSDLAAEGAKPTVCAGKPWLAAAAVAVAVPVIAFGTYSAIGTPAAADARALAREGAPIDEKQIIAMVASLAAKVRERPDDARGWTLLARSMAALGRFKEAAEAYQHLAKLTPGNPQILADYADALGMAQDRTLAGRPYELARQALEIDPKHKKALALAGTGAMDARDFASATRYWQTLAAELPAGSEDEAQVRTILAEIRMKAAAAGQSAPAQVTVAPKSPAAAARSISGMVSVAPEVAAKVSTSDTLYVFARAEGGPRMPLAILRVSAHRLPMSFALDDTMAMTPATRLSSADAVRVEARISRSGNATPQSGDLVGASAVVKPGARDVKIVVDKVLP